MSGHGGDAGVSYAGQSHKKIMRTRIFFTRKKDSAISHNKQRCAMAAGFRVPSVVRRTATKGEDCGFI